MYDPDWSENDPECERKLTIFGSGAISPVLMYNPSITKNLRVTAAFLGFYNIAKKVNGEGEQIHVMISQLLRDFLFNFAIYQRSLRHERIKINIFEIKFSWNLKICCILSKPMYIIRQIFFAPKYK